MSRWTPVTLVIEMVSSINAASSHSAVSVVPVSLDMDGTFWTFLLARVDPPKLKELVAEAFGVSEQHLYIAWPDFGDG